MENKDEMTQNELDDLMGDLLFEAVVMQGIPARQEDLLIGVSAESIDFNEVHNQFNKCEYRKEK